MKNYRVILLSAVLALTANFGYAQNTNSEPTIYVGNKILGGKIDKDTILAYPFFNATSNDGTEWNVVSYRLTIVRQIGGNSVEDKPIAVSGAEFTEQIKSLIQTAPSGTNLEFSEIRVQGVLGTRTIATPLMVRIK